MAKDFQYAEKNSELEQIIIAVKLFEYIVAVERACHLTHAHAHALVNHPATEQPLPPSISDSAAHAHAHATVMHPATEPLPRDAAPHAITTKPLPDSTTNTDYDTLTISAADPEQLRIDWGEPVYNTLNWLITMSNLPCMSSATSLSCPTLLRARNIPNPKEQIRSLSPDTLACIFSATSWKYTSRQIQKKLQEPQRP
jgi:hypothetical protein